MATRKKNKFKFRASTDPADFELGQLSKGSQIPKAKQVKKAKNPKQGMQRLKAKYPGRKKRVSVPSDY